MKPLQLFKRLRFRALALSPLFLLLSSTPLFAQSADNSPLNDDERRLILQQLYELRGCREEVKAYQNYSSRDIEQDAREKTNWQRSLDLEKEATRLAKERAEFYENAFRSITKKPSVWCWVKRILTLGIHRCN
jgi:hypothetical protein